MHVASLTVRNLRILKEIDLEDFGSLNVFIGQNATGKSVALRALDSLLEYPQLSLGADDPFRGTPSEPIQFSCSLQLDREEVGDLLRSTARRHNRPPPGDEIIDEFEKPLARGISLRVEGVAPEAGTIINVGRSKLLQDEDWVGYLSRVLSREAQVLGRSQVSFQMVLPLLDSVISRRTVYLPVQRGLPPRFSAAVAEKGRPQDLGPWVLKMRGEKRPEFDVYERRLGDPLSHVKGLTVSPGPGDFRLGLMEANLSGITPAEGWSSGTSHLAMFLGAMTSMPHGSVVIAEEPELSLHPAAIRQLMDKVREVADAGQFQFFLTTHSDIVVEGLDPAGKKHTLWRFSRSPDGSSSAVQCKTENSIAQALDDLRRRPRG